ncbi:MAG: dimethylsulfonioproprionate lyase family protein [Hyphomicrobiaceae bacterium]
MQHASAGPKSETEAVAALLAHIDALYRCDADRERAGGAMLSRAAGMLATLVLRRWNEPALPPLPVRRFLGAALANARGGPLAQLAGAFERAEPAFDWLQNPNYTAARMGPEFVDRYGYVELAGPGRPFESCKLLVGFLLLGPRTLYPVHNHAAEEVYHVVSGRASWRRGDGAWRTEPPGAVIHHAPHVPHAMRTEDEPLLALYCWMGDVTAPADLLKDERHG